MSNFEEYKLYKSDDFEAERSFKLSNAQSFVFLSSDSKSLVFVCSLNEYTKIKLRSIVIKYKRYFNSIFEKINVKIVGPVSHIELLTDFFHYNQCNIEKTVVRMDGLEAIYNPKNHKVRLLKNTIENLSHHKDNDVNETTQKKCKVLIVDDSSVIRDILSTILNKDDRIEVIGSLGDPTEVISFIEKNRPDVITLDLFMPKMNGLEVLSLIRPLFNIPVIMLTSASVDEGPHLFEAMELGAFDYIQKPKTDNLSFIADKIIDKVLVAGKGEVEEVQRIFTPEVKPKDKKKLNTRCLICIGSSTGGVDAITKILTGLPEEIPPILIVQHIPLNFSSSFAQRLSEVCPFEVKLAVDGDEIKENRVLIAPGGLHMKFSKRDGKRVVALSDGAEVNRFRPSIDVLFNSIVEHNNLPVIAMILTGMGRDGAEGMLNLKNKGAVTICQSESTCTVAGMPNAAKSLGAIDYEIDLPKIADKIIKLCQKDGFKKNAA
jgi:two-component system chemotaxis response regulator CheB